MELLSAEHVGAVAATVAAAAAAVPAVRRWPVATSRSLAVLIGVAYAVEHAWFVERGTWSPDFNLPLHLTDVVTVVAVLALWTCRPLLVELTWFWGLTASLQAVLTPDLGADFPELLYWTFFITHGGAVVAAIVLVIGLGIEPRPGSVQRAFAATVVVAAVAGTANVVTGGNYMWLREKPDTASLLDVMGPWPWYILSAAALALALFWLLALPFRRRPEPVVPAERVEEPPEPVQVPARVTRYDYLGRAFDIPETVQPVLPVSHLLGSSVLEEVREEDRVLDMGTGSGVNAVLAATKARHVVAVDADPDAVEAARHNAELNGVSVEAFESDGFDKVEGAFDLIVFDPHLRATADEDHRALRAFFEHLDGHLAPGGRVLVFFGSSGDVDLLHRLIAEAGLAREELKSLTAATSRGTVTYWTFRLTRA